MNITLNEITDLVAIRMGEYPEWRGVPGMTIALGSKLSEMVRPLVAPIARQVVADLPLSDCKDTMDLSPVIASNTDWGEEDIYRCALPADFFRLHSLMMPDWPKALSGDGDEDRLRQELGSAAPEWMKKRAMRPMVRIFPATESATAEIHFGPTASRRPVNSAYIPIPEFDEKSETLRKFQPAALMPMVEAIAAYCSSAANCIK